MNTDTISIIVLIISFVILVGCLFYEIKKNGLIKVAIQIIEKAEDIFGRGKGQEKMQYAITQLLVLLPKPIRYFVTVDAVEEFINDVFKDVKEMLHKRYEV